MNKKKKYIIIGCLIILTVSFFIGINIYHSKHVKASPLYLAVSAYRMGEQGWEPPYGITFVDGSGEEIFLRGMEAFDRKAYTMAKGLFEQALGAAGSDPALPAFLYFYINQCDYYLKGTGNIETVSLALAAIRQYAPFSNDTEIVLDLVNSVSQPNENCEQVVKLLQEHLESTDNLELLTWTQLKNTMGMLEYTNQKYTKSIQQFYDVELALEEAKTNSKLKVELVYAKEFIANIHFIFEDYERAAAMYQEVIDLTMDTGDIVAYGCYVNSASAYLEISELEKAREILHALEKQLPYAEKETALEIEACMNDLLANICIMEENYEEAAGYLDKAEVYYQNNEGDFFIDGEYFIKFTRCKYMLHTGAIEESQGLLEEMVSTGATASHGMEREAYKLLIDIYRKTGENEKLFQTYQSLLELNKESLQMLQGEYLEFSKYYQDNNRLIQYNNDLYHINIIAVFSVIVISGILIIILILLRLLSIKNVTDQLTGVYNRKKLNQLLHSYKCMDTPANFGVVMMDIDYFKRYNDIYGHPAGDKALKEVAKVIMDSARRKDVIVRYGGEEFLALLSGVQLQTAEEICHQIQENLKKRAIPHAASEVSEYVTLSMGLCYQSLSRSTSLEKLIEYADECLYQSKEAGKNCVTIKEL